MIKALLLILTCLVLYKRPWKLGKVKESIQIEQARAGRQSFDESALKKARLNNLPLIQEWVEQMNESPSRRTISCWEFAEGESDVIAFTFLFESKAYIGKLYFKSDKDHPRVSKCVYEEDGISKILKGFILPAFSDSRLLSGFLQEKADLRHISYINRIATEALKNGKADFSILEYEDIKPSEFEALFGKKEVKAFCRMLEKEDFESAEQRSGPVITVTPRQMPE